MRLRIGASLGVIIPVLLASLTASQIPATTPATASKPVAQHVQATAPQAPLSVAVTASGYPKFVNPASYNRYHGPNLSNRVVLSFDDCPRTLGTLNAVLQYAHDHNIGLVLAPTGDCADKFKKTYHLDLATHMRAYGQYVINHSRTHPNLTKLTPAGIRWELTGQVAADYGRPPFGAKNKTVDATYKAVGMREWLWNVDTRDWANGGHPEPMVVDYVVKNTCGGCTVLMHMQHSAFNPHAISAIETGLRTGPKHLLLCRAYRGWGNPPAGPVLATPAKLGNYALPC